jgi:hypothetical protein
MGEMRNAYKIRVGNPIGRDHLGDTVADRMIILKWTGFEGVGRIIVAQDRDRLRALLYTVINF